MNKRGFTLIELLIVVTIMAILAGAAIPYVQNYVEESRISRAKADMTGYKDQLALWETRRSEVYNSNTLKQLMDSGFVTKVSADPWGSPYYVSTVSAEIICLGDDGALNTSDDIKMPYGPPLAVTDVYWIDVNADGVVSDGDALNFYLTRAAQGINPALNTDWEVVGGAGSITAFLGVPAMVNNNRIASYSFTVPAVDPLKVGGNSKVKILPTTTITDFNTPPKKVNNGDSLKIQAR